MPSWRRADCREVVLAMVAQLARVTGLDPARVAVTVLPVEDVPPFGAPQDAVIRVMGEQADEGMIDGSGRWDERRTRLMHVAVRTRMSLDEEGRDLARLTDESLGHLALEDLALEALELVSLPGSGGDVLTAPLRLGRLTDPARMKTHKDWIYSSFGVEATYVRDVDTDFSLDAQFPAPA